MLLSVIFLNPREVGCGQVTVVLRTCYSLWASLSLWTSLSMWATLSLWASLPLCEPDYLCEPVYLCEPLYLCEQVYLCEPVTLCESVQTEYVSITFLGDSICFPIFLLNVYEMVHRSQPYITTGRMHVSNVLGSICLLLLCYRSVMHGRKEM